MKKILSGILIIVLVLIGVLVIAKDAVLKAAIETGVTTVTGFETKVQSLKFDFPKSLQIQGLKINNPAGFEHKVFADIPEIYVSVVLDEALRQEKIHLPELRLDIQHINVEKNKDGVSNVQMLTAVGGKGAQPKPAAEPAAKKPAMPFQLDKLVLTMRKVEYHDPSAIVPQHVAVDMNVNGEIVEGITDPKALVSLILMKIFYGTTFGNLMGLSPDALTNSVKGSIATGEKFLRSTSTVAAAKAEDVMKQTTGQLSAKTPEALKSAASGATSVLGDAGSTAKDQVTGLFGKLKSTVAAGEKTAQ